MSTACGVGDARGGRAAPHTPGEVLCSWQGEMRKGGWWDSVWPQERSWGNPLGSEGDVPLWGGLGDAERGREGSL